MQAQMTGVEVAGQNLANVNTPGYSRQRVNLQTTADLPTSVGPEGTGVQVTAIQQIVSTLLNGQIQTQSGVGGYWSAQQGALQNAQNSLNEFLNSAGSTDGTGSTSSASNSNSSLSALLSGFFTAFQAVATAPTSLAARQELISQAQSLASAFNNVSDQIGAVRTAVNDAITNDVDSANDLLASIADLNKQISFAEFSGGTANNLRDQRQQALENLAHLTSITTSTGTDGSINVSVGGQLLVNGQSLQDTLQAYDNGGGQWLVRTATGQVPLTLTSGTVQGYIDVRDGTLADLQTNIDSLATTLLTQVNTVHGTGFNLAGTNGNSFFTGTDAATISVNAVLAGDPSLVQAAGSSTATADNSVALAIAQLATSPQAALGNQTFTQSYSQIVGSLGDALRTANNQVDNQEAVANLLDGQRNSISGVSLDEEMTTLMSFQRAYSASAGVLTTVDQMIQTTLAMKR